MNNSINQTNANVTVEVKQDVLYSKPFPLNVITGTSFDYSFNETKTKYNTAVVTMIESENQFAEIVKNHIHYSFKYLTEAKIQDCYEMFGFFIDFDSGFSIERFKQTSIYKMFNNVIMTSKSHQQTTKIKQDSKTHKQISISIYARDRFHVYFPFAQTLKVHNSDLTDSENEKIKKDMNAKLHDYLEDLYNKEELLLTSEERNYLINEKIADLKEKESYKRMNDEDKQKEIDIISKAKYLSGDISVSDLGRAIFPSRQPKQHANDSFHIESKMEGDYISWDYILSETKQFEEIIKQKSKKTLSDTFDISKVNVTEYEIMGDTDDNFTNAIKVLQKSPITYHEYVKIAFSISNLKGESGISMFGEFGNNPHFQDSVSACEMFYQKILQSTDRQRIERKIGANAVVEMAVQYGFEPVYYEKDFNTAVKLAKILNITASSLINSKDDELKMVFSDGTQVYQQVYKNTSFSNKMILRKLKIGSAIALKMADMYPPFATNVYNISQKFGIGLTNNGKKLLNGESIIIDDLISEVKTAKIINNPFDTEDECRKLHEIKKTFKLPTPDMNKTKEYHDEQSKTFEYIVKSIWCNHQVSLDTILDYITQVTFEQRDGKGQARPIVLMRSFDRGKGKNLLADFFKLIFGDDNIAKGDLTTAFNDFFSKAFVIFDEKENDRLKLSAVLKEIMGDNNANLNAKYGNKIANQNVFCNVIVTSNSRPIAITEMSSDEFNNPYIYIDLSYNKSTIIDEIMKKFNTHSISETMYESFKSWLWVKGVERYISILNYRKVNHCRYGIKIPVTQNIEELKENSITQSMNSSMSLIAKIYRMSEGEIENAFYSPEDALNLQKLMMKAKISIPLIRDVLVSKNFSVKKEAIEEYFIKADFIKDKNHTSVMKVFNKKTIRCTDFNTAKFLKEFSPYEEDFTPPMLPTGTDGDTSRSTDLLNSMCDIEFEPKIVKKVSNTSKINGVTVEFEAKVNKLKLKDFTSDEIADMLSCDIKAVEFVLNKGVKPLAVQQEVTHLVKSEVKINVEQKSNLSVENTIKVEQKISSDTEMKDVGNNFTECKINGKKCVLYKGISLLDDTIDEIEGFEDDYCKQYNIKREIKSENQIDNIVALDETIYETEVKQEDDFIGVLITFLDSDDFSFYCYDKDLYSHYEILNEKGVKKVKFDFISEEEYHKMA